MKKGLQYLNGIEKKVINAFVQELRDKLGDNIITVRLFGSEVKGNFKGDSDIDIFILVKEKTSKIRDLISQIEAEYDIKYNLFIQLFTAYLSIKKKIAVNIPV